MPLWGYPLGLIMQIGERYMRWGALITIMG